MRRLARVIAPVALAASLVSGAPLASAATMTKEAVGPALFVETVDNLCSFPVTVRTRIVGGTNISIFIEPDLEHTIFNNHITFQRTFIANGKVIRGDEFTRQQRQVFRHGTLVKATGTGQLERIVLPSGEVVQMTGRINFFLVPVGGYITEPTAGNAKNFDALCAALAA